MKSNEEKELSPFLLDGWEWEEYKGEMWANNQHGTPVFKWTTMVRTWNAYGLLHPSEGGGFQRHTPGDPMPCDGDMKVDVYYEDGHIDHDCIAASIGWEQDSIWEYKWRPHFATPTACNEPKQAPRFEYGEWYKRQDQVWACTSFYSGELVLVDIENFTIIKLGLYPFSEFTPCNPDGSPLAFEPEVGDVWTDGTQEYTLTKLRPHKTIVKFALWQEREKFFYRGFYDTPAEAVEGLTRVRRAGE